MHYWTPQEDEALLSLAMPAAQTAERMSAQFRRVITKNMVIGRRSRLREGGGEPRPPREPTPRKHIARTPYRPKLTAAATVVEAGTAIGPQLVVVPAEPSEPVRFMDLDNPQNPRMCRAIIGPVAGLDTLYCGKPTVHETSWCPACLAKYFNISATREALAKARLKDRAA